MKKLLELGVPEGGIIHWYSYQIVLMKWVSSPSEPTHYCWYSVFSRLLRVIFKVGWFGNIDSRTLRYPSHYTFRVKLDVQLSLFGFPPVLKPSIAINLPLWRKKRIPAEVTL